MMSVDDKDWVVQEDYYWLNGCFPERMRRRLDGYECAGSIEGEVHGCNNGKRVMGYVAFGLVLAVVVFVGYFLREENEIALSVFSILFFVGIYYAKKKSWCRWRCSGNEIVMSSFFGVLRFRRDEVAKVEFIMSPSHFQMKVWRGGGLVIVLYSNNVNALLDLYCSTLHDCLSDLGIVCAEEE